MYSINCNECVFFGQSERLWSLWHMVKGGLCFWMRDDLCTNPCLHSHAGILMNTDKFSGKFMYVGHPNLHLGDCRLDLAEPCINYLWHAVFFVGCWWYLSCTWTEVFVGRGRGKLWLLLLTLSEPSSLTTLILETIQSFIHALGPTCGGKRWIKQHNRFVSSGGNAITTCFWAQGWGTMLLLVILYIIYL